MGLKQRMLLEPIPSSYWVSQAIWFIIPPVGLLTSNRRVHTALPVVFFLSMAGWSRMTSGSSQSVPRLAVSGQPAGRGLSADLGQRTRQIEATRFAECLRSAKPVIKPDYFQCRIFRSRDHGVIPERTTSRFLPPQGQAFTFLPIILNFRLQAEVSSAPKYTRINAKLGFCNGPQCGVQQQSR